MISSEKHEFFESMGHSGLTYGDVRTLPGPHDPPAPDVHWQEFFELPVVLPDLESRFARGIGLKVPITSAAMDSVTESKMAIAMAKLGGLGVIHCAMPVEKQREEARRVKLHLNVVIENPVSFYGHQTVEEIMNIKENKNYGFSTFLVRDNENHLIGLLTDRNIRFVGNDIESSVEDIMTPASQIVSAAPETNVHQAFELMRENNVSMLPLVNDEKKIAGLYILSDVEREIFDNPNQYNLGKDGRLMTAIAVPTSLSARERIEACEKYIDVIVLDTARGDSPFAFKTYDMIRDLFPDIPVVSGNISVGKSAKLWAERGVDAIKVGQGGGSICTTRIETGIGNPQITAIYECAKAMEKYDIPVIADGGISQNGDLAVAIAAGAHAVMLGNMLAGTEESPGDERVIDGKRLKKYRGMGSNEAMRDSIEARSRYSDDSNNRPLAEGVSGMVAYKGSVAKVMGEMTLALRKGLEYSGARNIQDQREKTMLRRGTGSALVEARPHDLYHFSSK